jgi:PAS domain S-box-containing protein
MAFGAALSAIAGEYFLRRSGFNRNFATLMDVFLFLIVGMIVAPAISLLFGLIGFGFDLSTLSSEKYLFVISWWVSKAIGIIAFAPIVLLFRSPKEMKVTRLKVIEAMVLSIVVLFFVRFAFYNLEGTSLWDIRIPQIFHRLYLVLPIVIWASLRFGLRGGSVVTAVVSFAAIVSLENIGVRADSREVLIAMISRQVFIAIVSSSSLVLSVAVSQAKTSEMKFKSMFYNSGVPMAQVDSSGRFVEANQKYCDMLGYSREKLLTMTFSDVTYPDDRQMDRQRFEHMYEGITDTFHSEKRYVRANGEIIWVTVDATLIPGESGGESFSIGVVKDVSLTRIAEAEAALSRADAIAANKAKSVFLANMSHEIRTPLGVILGFVELLKDESLDSGQRARFLETIYRNASELGRLIDDVLDLSKVEAGRLDINKEQIFLSKILDDIKQTFEVAIERKGLRLEVKSSSGVPETIVSDQNRLRQILINIVGNAIKFTSFGSISIELSMLPPDDNSASRKLAITVKDTGCGIGEGDQAKLFVPFGQASKTTSKDFGGTGLGLVLSKRLARLLGGDVVLTKSHVSEGSTFTITIDPGTAEQIAGQVAQVPLGKDGKFQSKPLTGKRILVAEDTPDQAMLIQLFLTDQGATVETVANGAQAIEKAPGGHFDAVLMDMQMPLMDGFAATRKLRELGFRKPILALTAQAMREDQEKCLEAGCTMHLAKPFTQKTLTDRLLTALNEGEVSS